jgi:predicted membrane-bound mannosyltransferase/DNA-binding beta-propeller fold protein YncE
MQTNSIEKRSGWLDKPVLGQITITWVGLVIVGLIILAVISRFFILDARVMSHDETIHVYHNAWTLFRGQGYLHDPLSHGPLQTILVALSYFLLGDSDFSARIPAALFSIATVAFVWNYRRYLGRTGAVIGMLLMLVSPYMLYYGRYVRNDAFSAFFGVVLLWAILRYLETGKDRYTFAVTAVTALHFAAKETAFIYTAQALIFLAIYFIYRISRKPWSRPEQRNKFLITLVVALLVLASVGGVMFLHRSADGLSPAETAAPAIPGEEIGQGPSSSPQVLIIVLAGLSAVFFLVAAYFLFSGYSWEGVRQERSFGLLILLGSFALPQLSAIPANFVGWSIPTNASQVKAMTMTNIIQFGVFLVPMFIISIGAGLLWNRKLWLKNAAIFYGIYAVLFTTVFTNGAGFFTGIVGSLGYWLKQQGVQRGSQPWYYYLGVQIPVYEYLPAVASILAIIFAFFGIRPVLSKSTETEEEGQNELDTEVETNDTGDNENEDWSDAKDIHTTAIVLLGFWALTSVIIYTIAGEKMPWLTVHITWPMILFGSWALGYLVDTTDWNVFRSRRGWLTIAVLAIFVVSSIVTISSLLGTNPPFRGKELENLQSTSTFMVAILSAAISGIGLYFLVKPWPAKTFIRVLSVFVLSAMTILTARTAYQASFINYDYANELLVYAHSASGVKEVMRQVEEISQRTTDGLALPVAHDGEYPFWWYLRNYSNTTYYGSDPTRGLRDNSIIIVGASNFGKIEHVVGQGYNQFDYIRLWWPNQDYFNLTWERIVSELVNPEMREALFQIWLNRDYTKYGEVTGKDMSAPNWSPSNAMRLYVRKDIVSQLWNYGVIPAAEEIQIDPYEGKQVVLTADLILGGPGVVAGQFQRPRGIAVASDGSLYIADTENNRIQHLAADGEVLNIWGQFGDITTGQALGGTFNQPWGIDVGPDDNVYVADTWNHRIQKFSPDGEFIRTWGYFGQAEEPQAFWGPRDVAVDDLGRVFVTDTGNKRIVVFDEDGGYIAEFGSVGLAPGQFDEPVGVAIDSDGQIYVADTWNQRIQVFSEESNGGFQVQNLWDVVGWYGQSLENKPYLAVNEDKHVFATDPEGYRVLEFDGEGELVRYWGDFGTGPGEFGLAGAVAVDPLGGVWVTDTGNSRIMYFTLTGPDTENEELP